jgi:diguanylate cyclase (GGDEF)-like protein/PAS domain S-box-containing protein
MIPIASYRQQEARAMDLDDLSQKEVLENLNDGVYLVDRNRQIVFWNRSAEELTGFQGKEVVGSFCYNNILRHVDEAGVELCHNGCPLAATIADGQRRSTEVFLHHKSGHRVPVMIRTAPLRDVDGVVVGAVEIFSDNAVQVQQRERIKHLENLALLDPLTGIPNRRYLEMQLASKLNELARYGWPCGVLFMDIDHFKQINDTYGHDTGDRMLQLVARTLTANARIFDTVGRWGGDEFLALVTNVELNGLLEIGQRCRALVAASELPGPAPVRSTLSIGAVQAVPGDTAETLLRRADALMYKAKESGRARVCS